MSADSRRSGSDMVVEQFENKLAYQTNNRDLADQDQRNS